MSGLADRFAKDGFKVTVLPRPKGQTMAEAIGFFAGHPAGDGQGRGYKTPPYLWRDGKPEPLPPGAYKDVKLRAARGDEAVGFWEIGASGKRGAVCWRETGGVLTLVDLHPDGFAKSYAMGCASGVQVGVGEPKAKKGQSADDVGLVWRGTSDRPSIIVGEGGAEISLAGTDGDAHVGAFNKLRAAMWQGDGRTMVLIGPEGRSTAAHGVADGEQVGEVWSKLGAHAAMWRGTAASMVDLNPAGFETSQAFSCAGGLQVGQAKPREMTKAGFTAPETHAFLWAGASDAFIDLHAVVPAPWNASSARAIEIRGDLVRIAGVVEEFVFHGDAPSIGARQACLWEGRRNG